MITFYPLLPYWLIGFLLIASIAALAWAFRHRNPLISPSRHYLLEAVRLLGISLLTFILLCPGTVVEDLNPERAHIAFLLDTSGSMAARDLEGKKSRLAGALDYLDSLDLDVLKSYPVSFYRFADIADPFDPEHPPKADAARGGTSLAAAFQRLDRDIGFGRMAAVVLVTDGIDHSGFSAADVPVPVFSVAVGTDLSKTRDIAIGKIEVPEKVSVGDEIDIEVPILVNGLEPRESAKLRVTVDGDAVIDERVGIASRDTTPATSYRFRSEGLHIIHANLDPIREEATTLNNMRTIAVEATRARYEILAYFPVLTNSFRPLVREFELDRENVFTACLKLAPGKFSLRGKRLDPLFQNGIPGDPQQLAKLNCVILSAFNGGLLSATEVDTIEQYVAAGGTLVLLGGKDSFGEVFPGNRIADLLPVLTTPDSFRDTPFLVSAEEGHTSPFVRQMREILAGAADQQPLPLKGLNTVADIKGSAEVLLFADAGQRRPLVVWHPYGRGKVVAVLTNSLHLWGRDRKQRQFNYGHFWRQLLAFARRTDDQADLLQVTLDQSSYRVGEEMTIAATVGEISEQTGQAKVLIDLFRVDGGHPTATLELTRKGRTFSGIIPAATAGQYMLRAQLEQGGKELRQRFKFVVIGEDVSEQTNVAVGADQFLGISPQSRVFELDQGAALVNAIRESALKSRIEREHFLVFETPAFLLALTAILLVEWYLRRRFNLF